MRRMEAVSRGQATDAIKERWDALTDEEVALLVAPHHGARLRRTEEKERVAAERKLGLAGMEGLLRIAIKPEDCRTEEQLGARMRNLLEQVLYADGRLDRIRHLVGELVRRENGRERSVEDLDGADD